MERPARIYIFERLSRFIDWQGKGKSPCRNIIQVAYYYGKKGDEVERPLFASTKGTERILEHDVFCSVLTYFSFPLAIQFVQTSWEAPIKIHIVTATRSSTYIARFTAPAPAPFKVRDTPWDLAAFEFAIASNYSYAKPTLIFAEEKRTAGKCLH